MAEAFDARELVEALPAADADFFPLDDLPNDVLVSVFEAVGDPTWVRHTVPLVCRAWNELYLTKDASPLHETLEVDFEKEVDGAAAAGDDEEWMLPVVHASRVIEWAEGRAGSVRKLVFSGAENVCVEPEWDPLEDFSAEETRALVAVVGPSLTDISIGPFLRKLCKRPFWESLRDSVVPAGRLRSLEIRDADFVTFGHYLEALGQLAGSLEELTMVAQEGGEYHGPPAKGLPRFPEPFLALKQLWRLVLRGHQQITAIPAGISSLKKLEVIDLRSCRLSSLPKELGELSGLTRLDLSDNRNLGTTLPEDEAFPAELRKLKSLRELSLSWCGLRTVPAFVGKLKSLESLDLRSNNLSSLPKELGELSRLTKLDLKINTRLGSLPESESLLAELGKLKSLRELSLSWCGFRTVPAFVGELESLEVLDLSLNGGLQINDPLDFLLEGCPRLREVRLARSGYSQTPESLAHLEAFKAKLRAKNPNAHVSH